MPSKVVQANSTAVEVAAERKDAVHRPVSMILDAEGAGADRTIRLQDVFTPSETVGQESPSETTVDRLRYTVKQGSVDVFNKEDLKGVKCLGALKAISDVTDAALYITVGYETK